MKASELRIGNYVDVINRHHKVHLPYGYVRAVGSIQFFKVELYHSDKPFATQDGPEPTDISDLSPIPLTEEWLLKFGFEDDSYAVFRKVIDKGISISVSFQDYAHTMLCDHPVTIWPNDYSIPIKCQYVHQLQNLYFALTGEELIIKQ